MARGFAKAGCSRFVLTDINPETLGGTCADVMEINPEAQVLAREGDVGRDSFVKTLAREISVNYGRIDYAVNCAGILGVGLRSAELPVPDFDEINRVNYRGTWLASRLAITQMLRQPRSATNPEMRGAIVNVASQLGIVARPGEVSCAPCCGLPYWGY